MFNSSKKSGTINPPVEFTASTTTLIFFDLIFSTSTKFKFRTHSMCFFIESLDL